MNEKEKKQKFLQLQFCMLLLALTLLPEFSLTSLLGLPSLTFLCFVASWRDLLAVAWHCSDFISLPKRLLCLCPCHFWLLLPVVCWLP